MFPLRFLFAIVPLLWVLGAACTARPQGHAKAPQSSVPLFAPLPLGVGWRFAGAGPWVSGLEQDCPGYGRIWSVTLGLFPDEVNHHLDDPNVLLKIGGRESLVVYRSADSSAYLVKEAVGSPPQHEPLACGDLSMSRIEAQEKAHLHAARWALEFLAHNNLYVEDGHFTGIESRVKSLFTKLEQGDFPGVVRSPVSSPGTENATSGVPHAYISTLHAGHRRLSCAATPIRVPGSPEGAWNTVAITSASCVRKHRSLGLGTGVFNTQQVLPVELAVVHSRYPHDVTQSVVAGFPGYQFEATAPNDIALLFSRGTLSGAVAALPASHQVLSAPDKKLFTVGYGLPRTGNPSLAPAGELVAVSTHRQEWIEQNMESSRDHYWSLSFGSGFHAMGDGGGGLLSACGDNGTKVIWGVVNGTWGEKNEHIFIESMLEHRGFINCALALAAGEVPTDGSMKVDSASCNDTSQSNDRGLRGGDSLIALGAREMDLWGYRIIVEPWQSSACGPAENGKFPGVLELPLYFQKKDQGMAANPQGGVRNLEITVVAQEVPAPKLGPQVVQDIFSVQLAGPNDARKCPSTFGSCENATPELLDTCDCQWKTKEAALQHVLRLTKRALELPEVTPLEAQQFTQTLQAIRVGKSW